MIRWRTPLRVVVALALLLGGLVSSARAQATPDPLASAIAAYTDLEFDTAATRLRVALALSGAQRLADEHRARALMYLGATEIFREQRPAASEAFRQLLLLDPRYRPDALTFPPEVVAPFQETRIGVRAVSALIAERTELDIPVDRLPIRVFASSLHDIRARVTTALGTGELVLYEGVIGDSLLISWDGREGSGDVAATGRYLLRIASRRPDGSTERELQVPLDVERVSVDTLPWPSPLSSAALRPETEVRANGVRQLVTGLAGALAVVVLPSLVGAEEGAAARYAVAGTLGIGGIVGLATASKPRPIPENIAFNRTLREEWERELLRVQGENARRLGALSLRIRTARGVMVEAR